MIDDVIKDLRESIAKAHEVLRRDLGKVRTGRAASSMLDTVRVDYYGTMTPLSQMASVNVPEPRLLVVKPWDKSMLKAVEKAISQAELGFNPQSDGDQIRVPVPPLTEERRKDMVKVARKHGEECKVTVRGARRDALELLSSAQDDGEVSEDEGDRAKKKTEEVTADATKQIDAIIQQKEKEILDV